MKNFYSVGVLFFIQVSKPLIKKKLMGGKNFIKYFRTTMKNTNSLCMEFLKEKTRFSELFPENFLDKNTTFLIKGPVQSGKSRLIYALTLFLSNRDDASNVLVILRNFRGDAEQYQRGWRNFLDEVAGDTIKTHYLGKLSRKKSGELVGSEPLLQDLKANKSCKMIALAHHDHLGNLLECLEKTDSHQKPLTIIMDEVDQLMYTQGDALSGCLQRIRERAHFVFGMSATLYHPLYDPKSFFKTAHTFILTPPDHYKGILDIQYQEIGKVDKEKKKKRPDAFLRWDPDLYRFLMDHRQIKAFSDGHPWIGLIKTERFIKNQEALCQTILSHPKLKDHFTVIVMNGNKVSIHPCPKEMEKKTKSIKTIQRMLQTLKECGGSQKNPRILILSHGLVGRGINVVSEDFGWHLTHMFYRPSPSTTVPMMIQSMRLCGIYKDNIPLTCFCERKVHDSLYRGHQLQEDIFKRLLNRPEEEEKGPTTISTWLEGEIFLRKKVPTCRLIKGQAFSSKITDNPLEDKGMPMEEFTKGIGVKMNGKEESHGVNLDKLKKEWIQSEGVLGQMIRFLYDQKDPISKMEFQEGVGYEDASRFHPNFLNGSSSRSKYGHLWISHKQTKNIILNPLVRTFLDQQA